MEQIQLSSMLDYMDRRDQEYRQRFAELQEQIQTYRQTVQDQAYRIEQLEAELAETQGKVDHTPQFDEQFVRFKNELLQIVEERYQFRRQDLQEMNNFLNKQIGQQTKVVDDLRQDVDKTHGYDEQILLARTEVERLNKAVSTFQGRLEELGKELEARVQPITILEEQRRSDARRLAELQGELPDMHRKIETSLSKIQMVEQQIPQFGKYELALEEVREEIRRHRDHMDFQIAQRERQIRDWTNFAETQEKRMEEYEDLIEKYTEHHQQNKRALESLQNFQERIQREQHEAAELQRLSQERQRAQLEKWQADYEQRLKRQNVEWKPQVTDLQHTAEKLKKRVEEIATFREALLKQMDVITQIIEQDVQARVMAAAEWQQRFEELATGEE